MARSFLKKVKPETHTALAIQKALTPPARNGRIWSPQQLAIFAWFQQARGNLVVRARAGTGKTTSILEAVTNIPDPSASILLCAFNKRIATELTARLHDPRAVVKTLHALGFGYVREQWGETLTITDDVEWDRIDQAGADLGFHVSRDDRTLLRKFLSRAKGCVTDLDQPLRDVLDSLEEAAALTDQQITSFCEIVRLALKTSLDKDPEARLSFDDMLFVPVVNGWVGPRFDWVLVDECQDMSPIQLVLARRCTRPSGHMVFVGDDRQCHPAGTRIEMTGGERKRIEDVEIGDEVVSYHEVFRGLKSQGRKVVDVGTRGYAGDLLTIHVGENRVVATPSHRFPTRFINDTQALWALYLMEQGATSRLGCCRLVYSTGSFGPGERLRHERADRVWVLAVSPDRTKLQITETITALEFGLPEQIFFEKGALKARLLKAIGDNSDRAKRCLRAFGRRYKYPIAARADRSWIGRRVYVTQACNLLPQINCLRVFEGTQSGGAWEPVRKIHAQYHEKTTVYSLKVEPTEGGLRLYVADRLLTHNSIYGFRGADSGCLDRLKAETHADELGLTVTYRCPKTVVEVAAKLVEDFSAHPTAPEGVVDRLSLDAALGQLQRGDVVLSRTNAPLVSICLGLLRNDIPACVAGRDIGKGLQEIVKKLHALTLDEFETKLTAWRIAQMEKIQKRTKGEKRDKKLQELDDRIGCLRAIADSVESLEGLKQKLDRLFQDRTDRENVVTCSTVHKAKGLEWKRVFLLESTLRLRRGIGPKREDEDWPDYLERKARAALAPLGIEEINIEYVAITRAQERLVLVQG